MNTVLFENMTVLHLVNKSPAFYINEGLLYALIYT